MLERQIKSMKHMGHLYIIERKKVKVKSLNCVWLFATPWTVAYQAPPSLEFSRQKYWSGLLFSSPGDLPNSGIKPGSPSFQADALTSEPPGKPRTWKHFHLYKNKMCSLWIFLKTIISQHFLIPSKLIFPFLIEALV